MLRLIPAPLHRAGLRGAYRLRNHYRRIFRPRLAGVSLVISDDAGRVMLVRHSYGSREWSFPGGGLARGEDPEAAARRELREELGCEAADIGLIATEEEKLSGAPHTAFVFAVTLAGEPKPDRREVLEVMYFAADDFPEGLLPVTNRRFASWRQWGSQQR